MNTATLHDGRVVSTWSEDWRHECEARSILKLPTREARRHQLFLIGKMRGPEAEEQLKQTTAAIWAKRKVDRQPD